MPLVDKERIRHFLADIQKEKLFLESIIAGGMDNFINDIKTNKSAKYSLIVLVEAMMNILQHILAKEKDIAVRGYGDTFVKSGRHGIIPSDLASRLTSLAGLRNEFLTHGYWKCDDEYLYKLISDNISDITEFVKNMKHKYLDVG
jgi:uncharacterized protein YutE (UPF0331/DUF86 family)